MINEIFIHDQSNIEGMVFDIVNRRIEMLVSRYNEHSGGYDGFTVYFDLVSNVNLFNLEFLQHTELEVSRCDYSEVDDVKKIRLILFQEPGLADFGIEFECSTIKYVASSQ